MKKYKHSRTFFDCAFSMAAVTVIAASAMIFSASAFAGGEAGSGGGQSGSYSEFYSSCDSAVGQLRRALRIAEFHQGNFVAIRQILVAGLANALREIPSKVDPLTKRAVERGLVLNSQFMGGCGSLQGPVLSECQDLARRTAVYFLSKYYDYILGSVYPLDHDYWIPYYARYRDCRYDDNGCWPQGFRDRFFVAYKASARALLQFYIGDDGGGMPEALAMDSYELHVAEHVLKWAADDLNLDLFRRRFACVDSELQDAAHDLADYNAGNRMIFANSRQAVEYARSEARGAVESLGGNQCTFNSGWNDSGITNGGTTW